MLSFLLGTSIDTTSEFLTFLNKFGGLTALSGFIFFLLREFVSLRKSKLLIKATDKNPKINKTGEDLWKIIATANLEADTSEYDRRAKQIQDFLVKNVKILI